MDDDNKGDPLEVLWERELDPEIHDEEAITERPRLSDLRERGALAARRYDVAFPLPDGKADEF